MAPTTDLHVLAISGVTISDGSLAKLRQVFPVVHYHPDHRVPRELWKDVEVWYTRYTGFPEGITLGDIPKTRALQLSSGESSRSRIPLRRGLAGMGYMAGSAANPSRGERRAPASRVPERGGQEADQSVLCVW